MAREQRVRNPVAPAPDSYALPVEEVQEAQDYSSMTKADLKAVLAANGLSLSSRASKADLIEAVEGI